MIAAAGMALLLHPRRWNTAISAARPEEGGSGVLGIVTTSLSGGLRTRPRRDDGGGHEPRGPTSWATRAALTGGYSAAFLGGAGIAVAGALLATLLLGRPKTHVAADAPAEADRKLIAA